MADKFLEFHEGGDDTSRNVAGNTWGNQSFLMGGTSYTITSVKLRLNRSAGVTGTFTVDIYAADGDGKPVDSVLASGSIAGGTISTGAVGWYEITLGAGALLTAGQSYCFVGRYTVAVVVRMWMDDAPGYADGLAGYSLNAGVDWTMQAAYDKFFELWGDAAASPAIPLPNAVSTLIKEGLL